MPTHNDGNSLASTYLGLTSHAQCCHGQLLLFAEIHFIRFSWRPTNKVKYNIYISCKHMNSEKKVAVTKNDTILLAVLSVTVMGSCIHGKIISAIGEILKMCIIHTRNPYVFLNSCGHSNYNVTNSLYFLTCPMYVGIAHYQKVYYNY